MRRRRHTPGRVRLGWAVLAAVLLYPTAGLGDEITDYQYALNAYDAGDYKVSLQRFQALLKRDPPITNIALLVEIHKYLGASHMFTGDPAAAAKQFKELLKLEPTYELDPVLFPTEVVDEFSKVKQEMSDELKKIEEQKKQKLIEFEAKRQKLKETWNRLKLVANHPPYVQQTVKESRLFLAFVPFGAAQLQNGHVQKGYALLGTELALLAATVTTYWLTYTYDQRAASAGRGDPNYDNLRSIADGLAIANKVCFWVFIAELVYGLIDGLVYFKAKRVSYQTVKEEDIPPAERRPAVDVPSGDIEELLGEAQTNEKY
jgi:hypothetical protein